MKKEASLQILQILLIKGNYKQLYINTFGNLNESS